MPFIIPQQYVQPIYCCYVHTVLFQIMFKIRMEKRKDWKERD